MKKWKLILSSAGLIFGGIVAGNEVFMKKINNLNNQLNFY